MHHCSCKPYSHLPEYSTMSQVPDSLMLGCLRVSKLLDVCAAVVRRVHVLCCVTSKVPSLILLSGTGYQQTRTYWT